MTYIHVILNSLYRRCDIGYRSDLYIKAKHEAFPQIVTALNTTEFSYDVREDDDYFYITLESYKWYNGYTAVDTINQLISDLGEDGLATMLRVGEEDGDVETYGASPDELDFYWHTNVELDGFDECATILTKLKQDYPEYFI